VGEQISDQQAAAVEAYNEQVLDFLIDSYPKFVEKDRAEGATDDAGALGGIGMLADKAIETGPSTPAILLSLAVRRLANGGQSNG
jgi:hypothetical protein